MFDGFVQVFVYTFKATLCLISTILLLPLIPNAPPDFKFASYFAPITPKLEGKLALNNLLENAEHLFEGHIQGPEGFAVVDGQLYTTLHDGYIARIDQEEIHRLVKLGQPCESWSQTPKCSRPLGIFAGPESTLYIADAYNGVFTYSTKTGNLKKLFGTELVLDGRRPKLFNSVAVGKDGVVYWSDSSTDFFLQEGLLAYLADGTGRLIMYDPKAGTHTILLDGLGFANGVALSPDEKFVVVAESLVSRLQRVWLQGPKRGQHDYFVESLPGLPDNLRAVESGFIVSLVQVRDPDNPIPLQSLYPYPYIRKAIARAIVLSRRLFLKLNEIYPNALCKYMVDKVGSTSVVSGLIPAPMAALVVVNDKGKTIDTFHGRDGKIAFVSDAIFHKDQLFLGSPRNNYLGLISNPNVVARFKKAINNQS